MSRVIEVQRSGNGLARVEVFISGRLMSVTESMHPVIARQTAEKMLKEGDELRDHTQ